MPGWWSPTLLQDGMVPLMTPPSSTTVQFVHSLKMALYRSVTCLVTRVKPYLLTPLLTPYSEPEQRFNHSLASTRNTVERQYGVWKRRFPALKLGMHVSVEKAPVVMVATSVRGGGVNAVVMRKSWFKAPASSSGRRGEKPYFRFSPPARIAWTRKSGPAFI